MLKKSLLLILGISFVCMISFGGSYTAPDYDSINFTLCSDYTAPDYDSINFTLGDNDDCPATDTCTCAGLNEDWEINMTDYCVISIDCDLGTGKLSFVDSGNFTVNATIDTTNMGDPGSGGIIWMKDIGIINVD